MSVGMQTLIPTLDYLTKVLGYDKEFAEAILTGSKGEGVPMTEAQWLASDNPKALLDLIRRMDDPQHRSMLKNQASPILASDRKLRLYEEACHHAMCGIGVTAETPLGAHQAGLLRDIVGNPFQPVQLPFVSEPCAKCGGDGGWWQSYPDSMYQADVLTRWRDCADCSTSGHTAPVCSWLTPTVVGIAQTICDTQDFGLMPMLADALEDAGCQDERIREHCSGWEQHPCVRCKGTGVNLERSYVPNPPGVYSRIARYDDCNTSCRDCRGSGKATRRIVHAKGCWLIDLVLGKD